MSLLHVTLFGKFRVRCGGKPLQGLAAQKVQELLAYLFLNRDRPHPREALASILWDHCSTEQSKMYLRRVLWQGQQALQGRPEPGAPALLIVEREWVQLNAEAPLWLDVAVFEAAYEQVRGLPGQHLEREAACALREAVELYTTDLLVNWYQDWCLFERERLQNLYLAMLDKLIDDCERRHEYERGFDYGQRILRIDRAREHTHRRLMRLRYLAGNRTGALRQYQCCAAALEEELGVRPAQSTTALYEQICADEREAVAAGRLGAAPDAPGYTLPDRLDHIINLQHMITSVQTHIQREIEAIEHALHLKP